MTRDDARDDPVEAELIDAARAWVHAQKAWKASFRATERPANLSWLKAEVGRAERRLNTAVDRYEAAEPGLPTKHESA